MSRYYRTLLAALGDDFLTGLVAYWAFENNANDALGVHNGTAKGSPTYTTGINGQAIDFGNDTTIRYVDVADSDVFSFTDGSSDLPFSISLWANFNAFTASANFLISKRNNTASRNEWQIIRSATSERISVVLFTSNGSNFIVCESDAFTTTNAWVHIVATYNGNENQSGLNLYVNGTAQTNRRTTGTYTGMSNTTSLITMGQSGFNTGSAALKHRGLLDEVAVWKNRELTAAEVAKLYNAGAGKFYPF